MMNFSGLKKVTVWLMLLGVLCVGVIPGDALAKKLLIIDTEGDPGDGMDVEGGSGGSGGVPTGGSDGESKFGTLEFGYPQISDLLCWNFYSFNAIFWIPVNLEISWTERQE
jgi:hypothetical protein